MTVVRGRWLPFVRSEEITLSKTAKSPPAIGRSGMMPAQFTTTSIVPNVFIASLKRRSTSVALATSAWTAIARPPAAAISATAFTALVALPA